jgi:hypothetical protein
LQWSTVECHPPCRQRRPPRAHSDPSAPFRVRSSVLVVAPSMCARGGAPRARSVCSAPCTEQALECSPYRGPVRMGHTLRTVCPQGQGVPPLCASAPSMRSAQCAPAHAHMCVRFAPCTPSCVFRFKHSRSAHSAPCAPSRALRSVTTVLCARPSALSVHPSRALRSDRTPDPLPPPRAPCAGCPAPCALYRTPHPFRALRPSTVCRAHGYGLVVCLGCAITWYWPVTMVTASH